jgi:transcriptional regulator with XRE-family HTH domain
MDRDPRATGARIAKRRHQLGWTQVELAARIGVSPSSVADWERGASYPKKKLGKVEQVLGVRLDEDPKPEPSIPKSLLREVMETEGLTDEERVAVIAAIDNTLAKERGEKASSAPEAARARHRPAS